MGGFLSTSAEEAGRTASTGPDNSGSTISFSHNSASDNAFQLNGTVYGNVNHYGESDSITRETVTRLEKLAIQETESRRAEQILRSLSYSDNDARRQNIGDPASGTFEWILNEPKNPELPSTWSKHNAFKHWLEHDHDVDLFWVAGKAGSGKSTLMKRLCTHTQTKKSLQKWVDAKGLRLITADHFFWHTGMAMQKSRQGLLQSLLTQVARDDPQILRILAPDRWLLQEHMLSSPWSTSELWDSIQRLQFVKDTGFALFVDGLDEYHPQSDHRGLATIALELARLPNVKVCVSGRPWHDFAQIFDKAGCPSLTLEELTMNDLRTFTSEQLQSAIAASAFYKTNDEWQTTRVVGEVLRKASGVFLWVHLVVRTLCDHIMIGSDYEALHECLSRIPSDMNEYFEEMVFNRISPTWRNKSETGECLKLAMLLFDFCNTPKFETQDEPLLLSLQMYYTAFERKLLRLEDILQDPVITLDAGQEARLVSRWKTKIEAISGGLLIVRVKHNQSWDDDNRFIEQPSLRKSQVEFIHRSAYDFLIDSNIQAIIKKTVSPQYHEPKLVQLLLLAACKTQIFCCEIEHLERTIFILANTSAEITTLQSFEKIACVVDQDHRPKIASEFRPYPDHCLDSRQVDWSRTWNDPRRKLMQKFLDMGLTSYVTQSLSVEPELARGLDPFSVIETSTVQDRLEEALRHCADTVDMLVASGADIRTFQASWRKILQYLRQNVTETESLRHDLWRSSRVMLEGGAYLAEDDKVYLTRFAPSDLTINLINRISLCALRETIEKHHRDRLGVRHRLWPEVRTTDGNLEFYAWVSGVEQWIISNFTEAEDVFHTVEFEGWIDGESRYIVRDSNKAYGVSKPYPPGSRYTSRIEDRRWAFKRLEEVGSDNTKQMVSFDWVPMSVREDK